MAFESWSALHTAILDAITDYVAGAPCVGEYRIGTRRLTYRSIDDLKKLLELAELRAGAETGPRTSYGRYRRFQ